MTTIDSISVDIAVVLGSASMPIHQMLRMGRGAVIELDASEDDDCTLLANNVPVAKGQVILRGDRIAVSITEMLNRAADYRGRSSIKRIVPSQAEKAAEMPDEVDAGLEAAEAAEAADGEVLEDPKIAESGDDAPSEAGDASDADDSFNLDEL